MTTPFLALSAVAGAAQESTPDPQWQSFFRTAFEQLTGEFGNCQLAPATLVDWLYNYAREMCQQRRPGLFLGTVHSAKGLEFRHVALLDGDWSAKREQLDEERRLYYVGMTRAEETLTLCEFASDNALIRGLGDDLPTRVFKGAHDPALDVHFQTLGLKDIDLGYPGRQSPAAAIHKAIGQLEPGDALHLAPDGERYLIRNSAGELLGRSSRAFCLNIEPEACEVAGIITRYLEDTEPDYLASVRCEQWEIVVPRVKGRRQG